ncbi:phage tail repeat-like family, partial [Trichomonas vaginalis G3]|uniref:phage tail repeat-like family n=1 Tax=Trichomonas vaginalis (strain ATCC PRA-98 / G3) TaxID=412133 RepID=UPI0021E5F272
MSNETASMRELQHNRQLIMQALNKNTTNFSNYSKISESLKEGNLKLTLNPMTDEFLFQDSKNHTVCINPTKGTLNEKPINELLLKADVDNKADKEYVDATKEYICAWTERTYPQKHHTHNIYDVDELQEKLDDKADKNHTHKSFTTVRADDIILNFDLGSSAPLENPSTSVKDTLNNLDNSCRNIEDHARNFEAYELPTMLDKKADKTELQTLKTEILQTLYPIGSIYTSMNSTRPEVVLGFGTWTQIVDRFLYCANSSKETGGSKTISGANLPAHSHYINLSTSQEGGHRHKYWDWSGMTKGKGYDVKDNVQFAINCYWSNTEGGGNHTHRVSGYTQTTGQSKDYMPPYMTVFACIECL